MKYPGGIPEGAEPQIEKLVEDYLPYSGEGHDNTSCSKYIVAGYAFSTTSTGKFSRKSESTKLRNLRKAIHRLRQEWQDIDPEVRFLVKDEVPFAPFRGRTGSSVITRYQLADFMDFGPEIMSEPIEAVLRKLSCAEQIGRADYPATSAINACAEVWEWRTNKRPRHASNKAFADFCQDVFNALGCKASVEAAIKSWIAMENSRQNF